MLRIKLTLQIKQNKIREKVVGCVGKKEKSEKKTMEKLTPNSYNYYNDDHITKLSLNVL